MMDGLARIGSIWINFRNVAYIEEKLHEWTGKSLGCEIHFIGSEPRVKLLTGPDAAELFKLIGPSRRTSSGGGEQPRTEVGSPMA